MKSKLKNYITDFFHDKVILENHIAKFGEFRIENSRLRYLSGNIIEKEFYFIDNVAVAYWEQCENLGAVFSNLEKIQELGNKEI